MTMPQFFVAIHPGENSCRIVGDDFEHLTKVRRVRPGDEIDLRNADGTLLRGKVAEIFDNALAVDIVGRKECAVNSVDLTLGVALLKGKKFDVVVQKAVEIGVRKIVPLITDRAVPNIAGKEERKGGRLKKIALEAAKQCMRCDVPDIEPPCDFKEFIAGAEGQVKFIAHPRDEAAELRTLLKDAVCKECVLAIGPEGGFSDEEIAMAESAGWKPFKVGTTCMRAETAAIVIPAIIMYEWSAYD